MSLTTRICLAVGVEFVDEFGSDFDLAAVEVVFATPHFVFSSANEEGATKVAVDDFMPFPRQALVVFALFCGLDFDV